MSRPAQAGTGMQVLSPVAGRVLALADVPDPVFAQQMVGPGLAVDPEPGEVLALAPISGHVVSLHPHAFVVVGDRGRGVLVHLGIGTIGLHGDGFTLHVEAGAEVAAGQPVIGFDTARVVAAGLSAVCPVIALDADESVLARPVGAPGPEQQVASGDPLLLWS